jgi:hypothetical protein
MRLNEARRMLPHTPTIVAILTPRYTEYPAVGLDGTTTFAKMMAEVA